MKKFLGIILGVLLIGSFTAEKAQAFTFEDLMSQIASLRVEVGQLRGSLVGQAIGAYSDDTVKQSETARVASPEYEARCTTLTGAWVVGLPKNPPADYSCLKNDGGQVETARVASPVLQKKLSYGLKGDVDVVNLQIALKSAGFLKASPNGTFGPATRAAVMAVQKAKGLPVTGVADTKTIDVISTKNEDQKDVDAFISSIPQKITELQKQIADLQEILKDPAAYKTRIR